MLKKIAAPLLLVGILWLVSSVVTTHYIAELEESYERANSENVTTIISASAMVSRFWKLHSAAIMADRQLVESPETEFTTRIAEFKSALAEAEATALTETEKKSIVSIRRLFQEYCERLDELRARTAEGSPRKLTANDPLFQLGDQIWLECRNLRTLNIKLLDDANKARKSFVSSLNFARHTSAIIGPLIGSLLGFWIARGLHRSVSQISVTLREAVGDIEHEVGQVVVARPTDLPALKEDVQTVAERIHSILDELRNAKYQIAANERLALAGELAAGVAHEIRNPLTSVKLLVQLAAKRDSNHSLNEKQLQVIQEEIGRMEKTIQGLLDFARPQKLHRVACDMRESGHRALNLLNYQAKQKDITITEHFSPGAVTVNGDPGLLHQVLVNLLLNSIEATPFSGSIDFAISIDDPDTFCRIVVSDSGSGLLLEDLDRIFDPFVTTKEKGTGLGLAISRRIIQEHGGTIEAANRSSGGAQITVLLPLSRSLPGTTPSRGSEAFGALHV